jgi:hypothetical protein
LGQAEARGDLIQQGQAAIGRQAAGVKHGCERLGSDGRQTGQKRCSVYGDGRWLRWRRARFCFDTRF